MEPTRPLPALHPNLAEIYRGKVANLRAALEGPDGTEAREAARDLIDQVIVSPPQDEGDPPGIEVIGELAAMLKAAGIGSQLIGGQLQNEDVLSAFASSVKAASGGQSPLVGSGAKPRSHAQEPRAPEPGGHAWL